MADPTYRSGKIIRAAGAKVKWDEDRLAVEELLEIRLGKSLIAATMHTSGNDSELVEGVIALVSAGIDSCFGQGL